jgi:hypothetical protein
VIAETRRQRTYPVLLPQEAGDRTPVRRPARGHPMARGLLALVLVAVPLLGHVWLESEAAQRGYRLRELRTEVAELRRERDQLRYRVAALRAPDRLEREAHALGLRPPATGQLAAVAVPPGTLAAAPQAAAPWWRRFGDLLGQRPASAEESRPR